MQFYFKVVLFTDECRVMLDGPDGWSKGSVANGSNPPIRVRRQQGGCGIMFWAGIIFNKLVRPWKVPEDVKMTSVAYVAFFKEHLEPPFKSKTVTEKGDRFQKWSYQGVASIFAGFEHHRKPVEHQ